MSKTPNASPESIAQRPRPGATRCPFCHEQCDADLESCACAECLSRHHRTCWDEAGGCSSCRATQRLEPRVEAAAEAEVGAVTDPRYGEAIDAWLKLGAVYNGGLAALTLLLLAPGGHLFQFGTLLDVGVGALLANLCFLLGPAIELAARRLGYRGRGLRWGLFLLGSVSSALLALLSCVLVLFTA